MNHGSRIEAKNDNPKVPIATIVYPASSHGVSKDFNYVSGIGELQVPGRHRARLRFYNLHRLYNAAIYRRRRIAIHQYDGRVTELQVRQLGDNGRTNKSRIPNCNTILTAY